MSEKITVIVAVTSTECFIGQVNPNYPLEMKKPLIVNNDSLVDLFGFDYANEDAALRFTGTIDVVYEASPVLQTKYFEVLRMD